MEIDWISLIQMGSGFLLGGSGVGLLGWKLAKRKGLIEVTENQWEAEDKRLKTLLDAEVRLTERMSNMNATIDKLIDRNRELSNRLYRSETELNRANERIIGLTEERDSERGLKEHYKMWHCRNEGCGGRLPPNEKLLGMKYAPPKEGADCG